MINIILTFFCFVALYFWCNYNYKYIVISINSREVIKVHSKPMSYFKAKQKLDKLREQYYNQTLSGYRCNSEAFIIKFNVIR